ncbi:MAG: hypothetical protein N838_05660 [Thiohalocapsa sp. PB-PSB1]|jgi:hydroxymethylpyrimidine pyrophosphatase-like HAD family hydrolase|nr:MAG: hypothetical protein N838_05660 [Thiohalocapsa sp. PB-PSB1]HCS91740.1 hypothetical protein [Chromatiaceae bacterium]
MTIHLGAAPVTSAYPLVVFTDLDDSLLQTRTKALARHAAGLLVPAADDRNGSALSFQALDQLALLHLLRDTLLIPVTGRNHQALRRVHRPTFPDYKITAHGSMIYRPDDTPLPAWHARVSQRANQLNAAMQEMAIELPRRLDSSDGLRTRVIMDAGLPVYVSLKWEDVSQVPAVAVLGAAMRSLDLGASWRVHHNGGNVAVLPEYANKAEAVRCVMEIKRREHPDTTFIGVGDSTSDTAFLQLCHFAVIPSNSQIQSEWSDACTTIEPDLPATPSDQVENA